MSDEEKFEEHAKFWEGASVNVGAAQAFLNSRDKIPDRVLLRALAELRRDVHESSWEMTSSEP